jgi:CrcB protein
MLTYFWIMFGGALGSGARFWASGLVAERYGATFPLGTLFVNVTGSFVIGAFAGLTEPAGPLLVSPRVRAFVMIGICGGYTTFSSFSLQTMELARAGDWLRAGVNSLLSLVCCLVAVWLGRSAVLLLLHR